MEATEKLAAWCDEVERTHLEGESECMYCSNGSMANVAIWPCHAIQGARAVRAAILTSTRPLNGICHTLVSMAVSSALAAMANALVED